MYIIKIRIIRNILLNKTGDSLYLETAGNIDITIAELSFKVSPWEIIL